MHVVHKFGGTSVGDAKAFELVFEIVNKIENDKIAIVVSGMGGKPKVTDLLLKSIECAVAKMDYLQILNQLEKKHRDCMEELLDEDSIQRIWPILQSDLESLKLILHAISIMESYNDRVVDLISGYGELWSSLILTEYLNFRNGNRLFTRIDAREVLKVHMDVEQGLVILWEESLQLVNEKKRDRMVITGFIASTKTGVPTTLKRDGSDYSASIFGKLLNAKSITIWTDVNGVLSADPRRVPESKSLSNISYKEAMELAYFGAKVIHPKTMAPAILQAIPIYIRNTFQPEHPGTRIFKSNRDNNKMHMVSGFSTVDDLALFNVEGSGMVGVLGVASRLFSTLEKEKVNVTLIAQASSEHSICFAIPIAKAMRTQTAIENTFFREMHHGSIQAIEYIAPISIIAAVGDGMTETPGVCARFFGAFRKSNINVLAISQGSSERNISAVIRTEDSANALRAVHSAFFLSDQTISVGVIITGCLLEDATSDQSSASEELFDQLHRQGEWLLDRYKVDLRIRAILDDRKMMLHPRSFPLEHWRKSYREAATSHDALQDADMDAFIRHVQVDHIPNWLVIDLSRSQIALDNYTKMLQKDIHIVTANVLAASCSSSTQDKLDKARCNTKTSLYLDSCIGAALPVLHVMRNLLQTGDPIVKIEAVLSATMESVLSTMHDNSTITFSQAAKAAFDAGLTGPKAFSIAMEDFLGITSARKLVILARHLGLRTELQDIEIDCEVKPMSGNFHTCEEICDYLNSYNDFFRARVINASSNGRRLSMICSVHSTGYAKVCLQEVSTSHTFGSLRGPSNAVAFYTQRYQTQPICVTGLAAGPSILASAVFNSILALTRELGARDHGGKKSALSSQVVRMSPSQSLTDLYAN